jgi:predicted permease
MRQLLTESLLLAILGGAVSLVVAHVSVYALSTLNPAVNTFLFGRQLPGLTLLGFHTIRLDSRALVFTFATALLAGLLFGLAPSWQNSRTELSDALKKATSRPFAFRFVSLKSLLVVIEIALAFVLLAGAGLMIKSSSRLSATQIGVDAENVLTVRTTLSVGPGLQTTVLRFTELEERIRAHPNVISAAVGSCHALASRCGNTGVRFPDRPAAKPGEHSVIGTLRVSANYFTTMKIPLLRGRVFATSDQLNAPRVVVVNETAAKRFWPNEDPIGKPISIGRFSDAKVIGVVADVRYGRMDQLPEPDAYFSHLQSPTTDMLLFVRTAGDPTVLVPAVRQLMHTIDPTAPVYDIKTMQARIGDATARMRFNAILLGIFAAIAMVLSAVGIFGVMSFVARQSTREIGIRMALGALSQDVIMQGLRRAAGLVVAGSAIGLLGALAVTRVLATSLYEVTPTDPQTYLVISILLAAVAMLASYIPVRRASLLNPSITLRGE